VPDRKDQNVVFMKLVVHDVGKAAKLPAARFAFYAWPDLGVPLDLCDTDGSGGRPRLDQDVAPRTTAVPSGHRPVLCDGKLFGGSLLGPELRSNFLPGNDILGTIAMLLAPSSELHSVRLGHRKLLAFRGDRIPDVLDQLNTLGERELANLIEKRSCHRPQSALGPNLEQVAP